MATRAQITRRSLLAGGLAAVVGGVVIGADAFAPDEDEAPTAAPGEPAASTTPPAPQTRTSLVMIGDSITAGSSSALSTALEGTGFTDVTIEAQPSRRIDVGGGNEPRSGTQALDKLLAQGASPDVWVVALGTNDIGKYAERSDYADLIDRFLARLPKGPLLWVDVYRRDYLDDTKTFNTVLRDRLAERGDASVASWFDLASRRNQKILQPDRLHPNEAGRKVFADLVANGVAGLA